MPEEHNRAVTLGLDLDPQFGVILHVATGLVDAYPVGFRIFYGQVSAYRVNEVLANLVSTI